MKKLISIIVVVVSFVGSSLASAESLYRELNTGFNELGNWDKVAHIAVGTAISYSMVEYDINPHIAAATPFAIGLVKELTDKNFNTGDLISWGVSGLIGAYGIPWLKVQIFDDGAAAAISYSF